MARIRTIKPDAWQDPRVGKLTTAARLLWVVLLTMSDDDGRFLAQTSAIAGHGYAFDEDSLAEIPTLLDELHRVGLIKIYVHDGVRYGAHPRWSDHQRIDRKTPSRLPAPPLDDPSSSPRRATTEPLDGGSSPERKGEEGKGRGAADAAAPRAGAHEAGDEPRGSGGDSTTPTPVAWPQVRAALQHAGFTDRAIDADHDDIADLLADEDRPINWPAVGRQLKTDRRPNGRKPPRCRATTPRPAVAYALNQSWPPLLTGTPAPVVTTAEPDLVETWPAVLANARQRIGDDSWDSWLAVIRPVGGLDPTLTVVVPQHALTWIRARLAPLLSTSASHVLGRETTVAVHGHQAVAA